MVAEPAAIRLLSHEDFEEQLKFWGKAACRGGLSTDVVYVSECAAADVAQTQEGLGARIDAHVNTLHMMLIKPVQYDGHDGWVNQIMCRSVSLHCFWRG